MFRKLFAVKPVAWWLLLGAIFVAVAPRIAVQSGLVDSRSALYYVQPILALLGAILVRIVLHGQHDQIRHKGDKALMIVSVISVWFVIYFLSGLMTTFVRNALSSSFQSVTLNIFAFGVTAVSVEYIRYGLMLSAGRRNAVWFGVFVSLILSVQQLSLLQLNDSTALVDIVKFVITYVMPALVVNLLLTYVSVSAGLRSQLVYSLGVVALTVLPPIIPKYDWYMTSMSVILLAVATYIMVDRSQGISDDVRAHRHYRRPKVSFDVAFGVAMIALVLFMTGAFTYKPVVIMSDSMVPVFARGSIVVVQKLRDPMDIQVGDVIQYEAEHKTITHRVVGIDTANDDSGDRIFTTKGDNSPSKDPPVNQSRIIGVVRSTVPYVGYPTVWLQEISRKK